MSIDERAKVVQPLPKSKERLISGPHSVIDSPDSIGPTTADEYPTMLKVNSIHANAPLYDDMMRRQRRGRSDMSTYMVRRRYLALINRHNGPVRESARDKQCKEKTCDSKPTPNPLTTLPMTIVLKPTVKVCMMPPSVNTNAPTNSVPRRPIMSPTLPDATDVTGKGEGQAYDLVQKHTESTNLENGHHRPDLQRTWIIEILSKVRTGDNPTHYPVRACITTMLKHANHC